MYEQAEEETKCSLENFPGLECLSFMTPFLFSFSFVFCDCSGTSDFFILFELLTTTGDFTFRFFNPLFGEGLTEVSFPDSNGGRSSCILFPLLFQSDHLDPKDLGFFVLEARFEGRDPSNGTSEHATKGSSSTTS